MCVKHIKDVLKMNFSTFTICKIMYSAVPPFV